MKMAQIMAGLLLGWCVLLKTIPPMIEVFKTDVNENAMASYVRKRLMDRQQLRQVDFDLQDRDHVLRIESDQIDVDGVMGELHDLGFHCCTLPDES